MNTEQRENTVIKKADTINIPLLIGFYISLVGLLASFFFLCGEAYYEGIFDALICLLWKTFH